MRRVRQPVWCMLLLPLWLTAAAASSAAAIEVAGVDLPAKRGALTLHGAGLLRKGFFFKIYVGALYLADPRDAKAVLSRVPKRLDIHYFHTTPRKHMVRVAEETLRRNLTAERYERHRDHIAALHKAYRDGEKGGCASLLYRPGEGLTYAVDGETLLTISDEDFANAYLTVWLGENPSSATMKQALLTRLERDL